MFPFGRTVKEVTRMSFVQMLKQTFQKEYSGKDPELKKHYKQKLIEWRKTSSIVRVEKPSNLARARALGYKAKKGVIVVRVRVKRSSGKHERPNARRRPKRMGTLKKKRRKSLQWIAEERAGRKYKSLEVVNSYWVGEDGQYKYYEVIMVDPSRPEIQKDKELSRIAKDKGRVFRAKTSAARKAKRKQ